MRYPSGHKHESRERILSAAADLFRRHGLAATGVDAVMAKAGLTAGAFYAHFRSKDALIAAAIGKAGEKAHARWIAPFDHLRGRAWSRAFVERYLSEAHRDEREAGCTLPSLSADVARSGTAARRHVESRLRGLVALVSERSDTSSAPEREQVIGAVALCVGGLLLARVVTDRRLSREILEASRRNAERLLEPERPRKKASRHARTAARPPRKQATR